MARPFAPSHRPFVRVPSREFKDPASHSHPGKHFTRHIHVDLTIHHARNLLSGSVTLHIETIDADASHIVLDTRRVHVKSVVAPDPLPFVVVEDVSPVGGTLTIAVPRAKYHQITIAFETDGCGTGSPAGGACDWLSPDQAGGYPFIFTQAQAVHARSIFPCQDTPAVKAPYSAVVSVEKPHSDLIVVMSAQKVQSLPEDPIGSSRFECPLPIPSYLFAFACGNLHSRELSYRSRVWALPAVVESAAWEFEGVEQMLCVAEKIAGPYVWGRYDLLVLPPSFPYGGMENPMLTFVTPTLLAGDRSLVSVIAHEIAHSWTGNLVSCQDCRHFWINEGFTVKLERRILAHIYGPGREGLDAKAGRQSLSEFVSYVGQDHKHTSLVSKLQDGEDPDDYFSCIPYEKGYNFLLVVEKIVEEDQKADFHEFLREYFDLYKYQSVTTLDFVNFLADKFPETVKKINFDEWLFGTGDCPTIAPVDETLVQSASSLATQWLSFFVTHSSMNCNDKQFSEMRPSALLGFDFERWDSKQKLCFLRELYVKIQSDARKESLWVERCAALIDKTYHFGQIRNSEIRFMWCKLGLLARYSAILANVEDFVTIQGRMKFIRPLFQDLHHIYPKGAYAVNVYSRLKGSYHSIARKLIERDLQAPR